MATHCLGRKLAVCKFCPCVVVGRDHAVHRGLWWHHPAHLAGQAHRKLLRDRGHILLRPSRWYPWLWLCTQGNECIIHFYILINRIVYPLAIPRCPPIKFWSKLNYFNWQKYRCSNQCFGCVSFWYGVGSSYPITYNFIMLLFNLR